MKVFAIFIFLLVGSTRGMELDQEQKSLEIQQSIKNAIINNDTSLTKSLIIQNQDYISNRTLCKLFSNASSINFIEAVVPKEMQKKDFLKMLLEEMQEKSINSEEMQEQVKTMLKDKKKR